MGIDYHHDYEKFRANVLKADWMAAEMYERALRVLARAEATAPFYANDPDKQHYRDAFSATAGLREDRAYGRVTNDDKAAVFVEFGTKNNPRHRTLGNALDAAGD